MLSTSRLQPIICTAQVSVAEKFYRDVLGHIVKVKPDHAVVFDGGGADLLVSPVESMTRSEHTV